MSAASPNTQAPADTDSAADAGPILHTRPHRMGEALSRLWPVIRPHRVRLFIGCFLVAIAGGIFGLMPLFAKFLIDDALPQGSFVLGAWIAGGFFLTHLVRTGIWYLAMHQILFTQEKVTFALRTLGFGHLQRLSLRFHNQYPSGFLYQSVFGTAINAVGGAMQTVAKQLSLYIVALTTSVVSCLLLSPPMTLILLLGSVAYVVIAKLTGPRIYETTKLSNDSQNQISDFIVDRLRGTRTIQAMAMEEQVEDEFATRLWPAQLRSLDAVKQAFKLNVMTELAGYGVSAAVMMVGVHAVLHWGLTVGELVAFMTYQATFILVVSTLTNVWGSITAARAGLDQLLTILNTPSSVIDKPDAVLPSTLAGRLTFQDVTFGYNADQPVLSAVKLTFPPGQCIALVGESGGGKTTLANLLLRFYDPDRGRILLDDVDIRDLPLKDYRALFGVVLQDPYLFSTTIAANLRCARPNATDDELREALGAAQAWDFVKQLPGQLNYSVGEAGSRLSGGQRQRLAIARCLLLRSRFVILDEPTSALDAHSEAAVQQAFTNLFRGRTVFIIAHRLSTIRHADRILVLQSGRVAQDGQYEDLAAVEGPFQRLHQLATAGA
jgi:subfamily B ATP-binding cassette protein MsbA